MNKKIINCLSALIIFSLISIPTIVNAKDSGDSSFSATVEVDSSYNDKAYDSIIGIKDSNEKYKLNVYTIKRNGIKYPTYCIEPEVYRKNMTVDCEYMSPELNPRIYSLIDEVYATRKNGLGSSKELIYNDLLIRLANLGDRYATKDITYKWITSNGAPSMPSLRAAYYNTYRLEVLGKKTVGYTNKDLGYTNGYSPSTKLLQDKSSDKILESAINRLKEVNGSDNYFVKTGTEMSVYVVPEDENKMVGKMFTLSLVEKKDDYVIYNVTSTSNVTNVEVTPDNATFEWVTPWNGTSGKIKVTRLKKSDCEASLIISGEGSDSTSLAAYRCKNQKNNMQDFLTIMPGLSGDKFKVGFECVTTIGCEPGKKADEYIELDIHNCCDDGETKVRQAALNDLFCDHKGADYEVVKSEPKTNADEYINSETNDYCTVYCGVTVMYKIPGPTRAINDRAFTFSTSVTGFAGPLLNQYKRCRTVIKFDQWYDDYKSNAQALIDAYEDNQYNLASAQMWTKMISDANTKTMPKLTVTCTTNYEYDCDKPKKCTGNVSATGYVDATTVKSYPTSRYSSSYKYANLSLDADSSYTYSKIVAGAAKSLTDTIEYIDKTDAEAYEKTVTSKISSVESEAKGKLTASQTETSTSCTPSTYTVDNKVVATDKAKEFETKATESLTKYNVAVDSIATLKTGLNDCGGKVNSATDKDSSPMEDSVKFKKEPEMEFSYTSKFVDDFGKVQNQEIMIPFEKFDSGDPDNDKHCASEIKYSTIEPSKPDSDDWNENWDAKGWFPDAYDTKKYKAGIMKIDDMIAISSEENKLDNPATAVSSHKNDTYLADKKFTTDAVHHMTCKWHDVTNVEYVLVPFGSVEWADYVDKQEYVSKGRYETKDDGTLIHYGYDHYMSKTFAAGKFETYYTLKDVGDGIIDDVIHEKGKTCSGKSELKNLNGELVNATCYIEVRSEQNLVLDCSRAGIVSVADDANNEEICEKVNKPTYLEYKEVNPSELFPNDATYGWNWKVDEQGKQELQYIEEMARADKTYAPENITYSFTLGPSDLRAIRDYNKSRIEYGGYNDFNLDCDTSGNVATKCKSRFIDAISGGTPLRYGSNELALNTNNMNLENVRSNWKEGIK